MPKWYSRPILCVEDVQRSIDFYARCGLTEDWRHEEDGQLLVAQVSRPGCELILACQWPEKNGAGMMFLSLDRKDFAPLRDTLEKADVRVEEGWWGYPSLIVTDPDGNQLYFPDPGDSE